MRYLNSNSGRHLHPGQHDKDKFRVELSLSGFRNVTQFSMTMRSLLSIFLFALLVQTSHAQRNAPAYAIIDNQTGYVLAEERGTKKLQPASLTKVATAMVVLDWVELTGADVAQMITIPPEALKQGPVNPMGLMAGDALSIRDLLYAALLQSDNIAAYTLAVHVGGQLRTTSPADARRLGPVGVFVRQMNALGTRLGMTRTVFLNPHGLDGGEYGLPQSTALDLAKLARYAMSKPAFRFYVSQKERRITIQRGGESLGFRLKNTNELLGVEGVDGVKTGRTSRAGDCLILSAARDPETRHEGDTVYITPRRITVVLLSSQDRFAAGSALLRQGWQLYDAWAAKGRPIPAESR
jgi:D-alanyl-D-alanine carboxypeptidase (penicillin-binding protein 5/6)